MSLAIIFAKVALSHFEEGAMGSAQATFRHDSVLPLDNTTLDNLPNGAMSIGNMPCGIATQGSHHSAPSGAVMGRRPLLGPERDC